MSAQDADRAHCRGLSEALSLSSPTLPSHGNPSKSLKEPGPSFSR